MPGNILDIAVTVGQAVTAGQTVLTMEAMKMENEIVAPAAGTVKEICEKYSADGISYENWCLGK